MISAMSATIENHFSSVGHKKPNPAGPIAKPNISSNVTRGSRVRRPITSVARPRRSNIPNVECLGCVVHMSSQTTGEVPKS